MPADVPFATAVIRRLTHLTHLELKTTANGLHRALRPQPHLTHLSVSVELEHAMAMAVSHRVGRTPPPSPAA